jgi:hypothetical protein
MVIVSMDLESIYKIATIVLAILMILDQTRNKP